jgi:hypothetical protein
VKNILNKTLPNLSTILVAFFALTQLIIPIIRTDLEFGTNYVSNYGVGSTWWLFSLGVIALAVAKFLLIKTLFNKYQVNLWLVLLGFSLSISATGTFLVALFPTDITGSSLVGLVHLIAALISFVGTAVFLGLFLAYKFSVNKLLGWSEVFVFMIYLGLIVMFPLLQNLEAKVLVERLLVVFLILGNYNYMREFK